MTCIIKTKNPVITREGNLWVIDGKTKVADLSECKFVHASKEEAPLPTQQELPVVPITPQPPQVIQYQPQPAVQHQSVVQQPQQGLELDLLDVVRLAGDNVWLAAVLVIAFLGKKYLEKMDLANAAVSALKGEIDTIASNASKQIDSLLEKQDAVSKKVEARRFFKIY